MAKSQLKSTADKETTFDLLDIRLGRMVSVEMEPSAPKKAYRMVVDFGKYGKRTSVGRFTCHTPEEMKGRLVMGVLNFDPCAIGDVMSEALILGVQYPGAESGEATPVSPATEAKIGSKLF
ncbi:MAG: tRNA-binding protein [Synergistota bacterium]|nr:tRNA-binding protein [Synergistota bacterium]